MKVSIIIPAYNASDFIKETINSVLEQTISDFEIIVVNDGSTDNTEEIVKNFTDPRIKLISKKNAGVSHARNLGFEESRAKFVAFLDADDVWLADNLEGKVKLLQSNHEFGLVHSDCEIIDANSLSDGEIKSGKSGSILESLLLWNGTNIPAPSSILVRRTVLEEVGGFDPRLSTAADQEFFFRVASKFDIGRINKVTWKYRVHSGNMHQNIMHMEEDHVRAYDIAREHNLFKSASFRKKCYARMYFVLAGSWWVNSNKHPRTYLNLFRSLISHPSTFFQLLLKKVN